MKAEGKIISLIGFRQKDGSIASRIEINFYHDPADVEPFMDKDLDVTISRH